MPRARTGTIQRYEPAKSGETQGHYVVRCSAPDGSRPLFHLDPSPRSPVAKRTALRIAEHITERLWSEGLGAVPRQRSTERPRDDGETVEAWSERWVADRRARGLSSVNADESRLEFHVLPELGPLPIADVSSPDIARLVEHLDGQVRDGKLAWKTAQNVWGLVSKMFADACKSKTLSLRVRKENPAADVAGPDRGARKAKAYLYPAEFDTLMTCGEVPLPFRRAVALAVYLFPRAGELEALEWSDIDLSHKVVHIHRALDRSREDGDTKPTKTGVPRRFSMEPNVIPLLESLQKERNGSPRVLDLGRDLARDLRKHLLRAGVDREELHAGDATRKALTFHDLRATGLTWMAIRGDDPLKIMQRAGHTDFRTTQLYVREAEAIRNGFGNVFPPLPECIWAHESSRQLSQDRRSRIKSAEAHGNRTHRSPGLPSPHRF